jgi:hypothetical protein
MFIAPGPPPFPNLLYERNVRSIYIALLKELVDLFEPWFL